ncbi:MULTISPECIES: amidohydrolase family protein [Niastella]|uniref:Amidohydrolase family protein n=1 Tax=Niastella soli TaxID=2821487 RepID=A0ABS3YMU6_9BACT|nr:amidohydrolase family protein [Niastella soli]MBO9199193.1 amidohydrolase family protein [Niastella soli]
MNYRKFTADHLFTGSEWLSNDSVLITGTEGEIIDIVPASAAGEGVTSFTGILSPGFVNCHCHLELSHMKGIIPEKTGMVDFLVRVIQQRGFDGEIIQKAIEEAENSMLQNGIVAVGDICNTANTVEQKKKGRLLYHNFIETMGFIEQTAGQRFDASRAVYEQFARLYRNPAESNSIVPHAPYSVSPALFQLITHFPGNHLLTIHSQESGAEREFIEKGTGDLHRLYQALNIDISFYKPRSTGSLPAYLSHFLPTQSVILVHNTNTNKDDLEYVASGQLPIANLFFCVCPNANDYIGNPLPNIDLLRQYKAAIVIGTDSLASNHQLSVLAELQTLQRHFPNLEKKELLQWATLNGAKALEINDVVGSFEPGKKPGVLIIDEQFSMVERLI